MKIAIVLAFGAIFCLDSTFAALAIVSSNGETCSRVDSNGTDIFTLRTSAPGLLPSDFDYMLVIHDTIRKLPFSTTVFHDALNAIKTVPRPAEPFGPIPCPEIPAKIAQMDCSGGISMTDAQKQTSGRYTWDRGHLTPVNPMRFSEDAANKTFYCVNLAPQDSYTNQNPWRIVEVQSETKIHAYAGAFVQTGLCSEDNLVDGPLTYRGFRIPKCFWKLVCYRDLIGTVRVVGFVGDNTLVQVGNTAQQDARDESTFTAKSQAEVLALVTRPELVAKGWTTGSTRLLTGRNVATSKIPSSKECIAALSAPTEVLEEWSTFIRS